MSLIQLFLIATSLAMDAFAVSISAGTTPHLKSHWAKFRISFHFGLFQGLLPIIGWFLGRKVVRIISEIDHWVAFILLTGIGIKMIYEAWKNVHPSLKSNPSKGSQLLLLSLATSIDAFIVGFSLALLDIDIWIPSAVIGVITAVMSFIGIRIGQVFNKLWGRRMEIVGGVILILIGLRVLGTHLL